MIQQKNDHGLLFLYVKIREGANIARSYKMKRISSWKFETSNHYTLVYCVAPGRPI